MKTLVVDDSGTMRKILVRHLNAVGVADTDEAADGVEALAKFQGGGYDLVLTDWNMPNKNGLELVKEIRASGSKVPILMVTTEAEKQQVINALQAGVNDYLVKPFVPESLREKLVKLTG